ncbi:hypothetical protein J1P26_01080 [Neobacillus sp. MM2021_6]|uniref:hypothetical protein n=1 Tax=Bacillaceae TaxID=186817 RepID=UPI0014081FF9|nr:MULTISPECIES: hypothetical protein [Bacillaceae]MBO0958311.1 hypothetical protein [Neobacillus sp. MM2021_6]NHC17911.1 hypothetical protein [Bacillus sp. MM2020_4]
MFKKILKSIIKNKLSHQHKYGSSSDAWKKMKHHKHSHLGHHHYKKKHKSGSFMSSFFSS